MLHTLLATAVIPTPEPETTLLGTVMSMLVLGLIALVKHLNHVKAADRLAMAYNITVAVYSIVEGIAARTATTADDKAAEALRLFKEHMEKQGLPATPAEVALAQARWQAFSAEDRKVQALARPQ